MRKRITTILLVSIIIFPVAVEAQNLEENLLKWLENNTREEMQARLEAIKSKYPNSALPLFIEAYLKTNGSKAIKVYEKIIEKYPNSNYCDNALLKTGQYYYLIESYLSAQHNLEQLINDFPKSPFVSEAKYIIAKCSIATGYYDSAEYDLKSIIRRYPQTPFKSAAVKELKRLKRLKFIDKDIPTQEIPEQDDDVHLIADDDFSSGKYTVQIGAFGAKKNAKGQKEFYYNKGFKSSIHSKYVNGRLLYLVWVGEFDYEHEALKFGRKMKEEHGTSYRVIKK